MEQTTLFWLFTIIFAVTAAITLLGITGVIKSIKEKYLNALFTALILEVVAAVFIVFNGIDFNKNNIPLSTIIKEAKLVPPSDSERHDEFIISHLTKSTGVDSLLHLSDSLNTQISGLNDIIENLKKNQENEAAGFYGSVNFLDNKIDYYRKTGNGKSINLEYDPDGKKEVYQKLTSILGQIGLIEEGDGSFNSNGNLNLDRVCNIYKEFKKKYSDDPDRYKYISVSDLAQLIKEKLKLDE